MFTTRSKSIGADGFDAVQLERRSAVISPVIAVPHSMFTQVMLGMRF